MRNFTKSWQRQSGGWGGQNSLQTQKKKKASFLTNQKGRGHSAASPGPRQYLHSRMVGLFLCRIFLNFPLKSRGGNGSRGKLARRPRTASSSPSEHSVSLSAMSLAARSSEDALDGGRPSAAPIILPCEACRLIQPISQQECLNVSSSLLQKNLPLRQDGEKKKNNFAVQRCSQSCRASAC